MNCIEEEKVNNCTPFICLFICIFIYFDGWTDVRQSVIYITYLCLGEEEERGSGGWGRIGKERNVEKFKGLHPSGVMTSVTYAHSAGANGSRDGNNPPLPWALKGDEKGRWGRGR